MVACVVGRSAGGGEREGGLGGEGSGEVDGGAIGCYGVEGRSENELSKVKKERGRREIKEGAIQ